MSGDGEPGQNEEINEINEDTEAIIAGQLIERIRRRFNQDVANPFTRPVLKTLKDRVETVFRDYSMVDRYGQSHKPKNNIQERDMLRAVLEFFAANRYPIHDTDPRNKVLPASYPRFNQTMVINGTLITGQWQANTVYREEPLPTDYLSLGEFKRVNPDSLGTFRPEYLVIAVHGSLPEDELYKLYDFLKLSGTGRKNQSSIEKALVEGDGARMVVFERKTGIILSARTGPKSVTIGSPALENPIIVDTVNVTHPFDAVKTFLQDPIYFRYGEE